jgi:hypothetical protein
MEQEIQQIISDIKEHRYGRRVGAWRILTNPTKYVFRVNVGELSEKKANSSIEKIFSLK